MEYNYCLVGIKNYKKIIMDVIERFKLQKYAFDIKLILTEAITNAYLHGNKKDDLKPIHVCVEKNNESYIFKIQDCGEILNQKIEPNNFCEDIQNELVEDCGRGLYLISCFSDKLEYRNNKLLVYKKMI